MTRIGNDASDDVGVGLHERDGNMTRELTVMNDEAGEPSERHCENGCAARVHRYRTMMRYLMVVDRVVMCLEETGT